MSHYTYIYIYTHIFFFLSLCKSYSFLPLIFPFLFPFTHSLFPFFPATTALFLALLPSYLTILLPSLLPGSTFFILPTLTPLPLTLNCPSITPPFLILCQKYYIALIYCILTNWYHHSFLTSVCGAFASPSASFLSPGASGCLACCRDSTLTMLSSPTWMGWVWRKRRQ